MGQTLIKILIALVIGLIAFQIVKMMIGGLIFATKAIFFVGLCVGGYFIVNQFMGDKNPTN